MDEKPNGHQLVTVAHNGGLYRVYFIGGKAVRVQRLISERFWRHINEFGATGRMAIALAARQRALLVAKREEDDPPPPT